MLLVTIRPPQGGRIVIAMDGMYASNAGALVGVAMDGMYACNAGAHVGVARCHQRLKIGVATPTSKASRNF